MASMRDLKALLLVTIFLIADLSALASAEPVSDEIVFEEIDDRMPNRNDRAASEDYGWWFAYGPDSNSDGWMTGLRK
jgi:hypothetical protein